jgi:DNA polymerase I-like protein with 3'-5' exonuclease and polymerase domains
MIAHIPVKEAQLAYDNYHAAFPGIQVWQRQTKAQVLESQPLVNPLGRRIRLFGRPWDGHTYKQGLSYRPQSGVADILDLALWRVWHEHDPELVQTLAQVHDAILGQYPDGLRERAIMALEEGMTIPTPITGADGVERVMVIPVEIAVGSNWGKRSEDNPGGLVEVAG